MDDTEAVARRLYDAYLGGDAEAMLALMDPQVEVRFLGQAKLRGIDEARRFFEAAGGHLRDLEFHVEALVVDGDVAAGIWTETAVTADGDPWENHGVDVIHVREGRIVALHENNDVRLVHALLPAYNDPGQERS